MVILPTLTLEDIQRNTERLPDGKFVVYCGPGTESIETFGRITAPQWTSERSSQKSNKERGWFGDKNWYGSDSYAQAMDMLRHGWPEGTAKMREITAKLQANLPRATAKRMHYRPAVAPVGGLILNIHDIATGGPQPFIGRFKDESERKGKKIVRIAVNNCVSAGTSTPVMEGRGAAVAALVTQLETLRIAVDLTLTTCSLNGLFLWHVKPAGYPMNADQLAFAMINNGAFRRLGFAMIEHAPAPDNRRFYSSYGSVKEFSKSYPEMAKQYDIVVDSECAYIGGRMIDYWSSPKAQIAWVKAQLEAQGINVE